LGNMGGILVRKLVRPTKVFCSWAPHQCRISGAEPMCAPNVHAERALAAARAWQRKELYFVEGRQPESDK
jgi:hypothetical protein